MICGGLWYLDSPLSPSSSDLRSVIVSYKRKRVHKVCAFPRKVCLDLLAMTVDWDFKPKTKES